MTDVLSVAGLTNAEKTRVVSYMDGFGRPIQGIITAGSPNGKDVVSFNIYDEYGRQPKRYLPYEATTTTGAYVAMSGITTAQSTFYDKNSAASKKIAVDNGPYYAEKSFESSPLERVLKTGGVGDGFQLNQHYKELSYRTGVSGDGVRKWTVNSTDATSSGSYASYELSVTKVVDETNTYSEVYTRLKNMAFKEKSYFLSRREINWSSLGKCAAVALLVGIVGILLIPAPKESPQSFSEQAQHGEKPQITTSDPTQETIHQFSKGTYSRSAPADLSHLYASPSNGGGGASSDSRNSTMILTRGGLDTRTQIPAGSRIAVRLLERAIVASQGMPIIGIVSRDYVHEDTVAIPQGSKIFGDVSFDDNGKRASVSWRSVQFPDGGERQLSAIGVGTDGQVGVTGRVHSETMKNVVGQTLTRFIGAYAEGSMKNVWQIKIDDNGNTETIQAKHVIVATGSVPRSLPFTPIDNDLILDKAGALALTEAPKRLGVIGAGVIGLEMGSVWCRLGAEVTILEAMPGFLMAADEQIAKEAKGIFAKEPGLRINTGVNIKSIKVSSSSVVVNYSDSNNQEQVLEVDKLIVAIGRIPNTTGLGTGENGLLLDERGSIGVDQYCRTNLTNVYAVGDVVRGPMLAHKASEEGVVVAEMIAHIEKDQANENEAVDFNTIPWVIYTSPEIAWVGKNEQELRAAGIAYKAGAVSFYR